MLETMFSFRGRLRRLPYFGYALLATIIGVIAIVVAAFIGGLVSSGGGKVAAVAGGTLAAFLAVIPMIWSSFALTAKRLRDAGFPPSIVIPAVIAFGLFDSFVLSKYVGPLNSNSLMKTTLVGVLVNLAYYGVVLFWPSTDNTPDAPNRSSSALSRLDDPGALAAAYRASYQPEPVSIAAAPAAPVFAAPALAVPGGLMPSFGRRRHL